MPNKQRLRQPERLRQAWILSGFGFFVALALANLSLEGPCHRSMPSQLLSRTTVMIWVMVCKGAALLHDIRKNIWHVTHRFAWLTGMLSRTGYYQSPPDVSDCGRVSHGKHATQCYAARIICLMLTPLDQSPFVLPTHGPKFRAPPHTQE